MRNWWLLSAAILLTTLGLSVAYTSKNIPASTSVERQERPPKWVKKCTDYTFVTAPNIYGNLSMVSVCVEREYVCTKHDENGEPLCPPREDTND